MINKKLVTKCFHQLNNTANYNNLIELGKLLFIYFLCSGKSKLDSRLRREHKRRKVYHLSLDCI